MRLSIDGWAADRLSVFAWLGVGVGAAVAVWTGYQLSEWAAAGFTGDGFSAAAGGALFLVFLGMGVYESGTPDIEGTCDNCGEYVRVDDAEDRVSECVEVHAAGTPKRISAGPVTAVARTARRSWFYCSPACAAADSRVLIGPNDAETVETSRPEVSES